MTDKASIELNPTRLHPCRMSALFDEALPLARLQELERRGVYLDVAEDQEHILSKASAYGRADIVTHLLQRGINPNEPGPGGSPLFVASQAGYVEVVRALITNKANVNYLDPISGLAPLHIASAKGHKDVVQQLLTNQAHPEILTQPQKETPLTLACFQAKQAPKGDRTALVELLLDFGCSVNQTGPSGVTPLMVAATSNDVKLVQLLLSRGSIKLHQDAHGRKALEYAEAYNAMDVALVLKQPVGGSEGRRRSQPLMPAWNSIKEEPPETSSHYNPSVPHLFEHASDVTHHTALEECAVCGQHVGSQSIYACNRYYHKACFVCVVCQTPFGPAGFLIDLEGNPCHEACLEFPSPVEIQANETHPLWECCVCSQPGWGFFNMHHSESATVPRCHPLCVSSSKTMSDYLHCISSQTEFKDLSFPAAVSSILQYPSTKKISMTHWARASAVCRYDFDGPVTLFGPDGPLPSHVQVGTGSFSWLLAAFTLLSEKPGVVRSAFSEKCELELGYIQTRLCYGGWWRDVVVDNRFPCLKSSTLFSSMIDGVLWPALLEKTFAKLAGCYQALQSGQAHQVLTTMTGNPSMEVNVSLVPQNALSGVLMDWKGKGYLTMARTLGASSASNGESDLSRWLKARGLFSGTYYGILDLRMYQNTWQIQLRNYSGSLGWNGTFVSNPRPDPCDLPDNLCPLSIALCCETDRILQDDDGSIPAGVLLPPNAESLLNSDETNGTTSFWMPLREFHALFKTISLCLHRPEWYDVRVASKFIYPKATPANVIELYIERDCETHFSLNQGNFDLPNNDCMNGFIALAILCPSENDDNDPMYSVLAYTGFRKRNTVWLNCHLKVHRKPYILVPICLAGPDLQPAPLHSEGETSPWDIPFTMGLQMEHEDYGKFVIRSLSDELGTAQEDRAMTFVKHTLALCVSRWGTDSAKACVGPPPSGLAALNQHGCSLSFMEEGHSGMGAFVASNAGSKIIELALDLSTTNARQPCLGSSFRQTLYLMPGAIELLAVALPLNPMDVENFPTDVESPRVTTSHKSTGPWTLSASQLGIFDVPLEFQSSPVEESADTAPLVPWSMVLAQDGPRHYYFGSSSATSTMGWEFNPLLDTFMEDAIPIQVKPRGKEVSLRASSLVQPEHAEPQNQNANGYMSYIGNSFRKMLSVVSPAKKPDQRNEKGNGVEQSQKKVAQKTMKADKEQARQSNIMRDTLRKAEEDARRREEERIQSLRETKMALEAERRSVAEEVQRKMEEVKKKSELERDRRQQEQMAKLKADLNHLEEKKRSDQQEMDNADRKKMEEQQRKKREMEGRVEKDKKVKAARKRTEQMVMLQELVDRKVKEHEAARTKIMEDENLKRKLHTRKWEEEKRKIEAVVARKKKEARKRDTETSLPVPMRSIPLIDEELAKRAKQKAEREAKEREEMEMKENEAKLKKIQEQEREAKEAMERKAREEQKKKAEQEEKREVVRQRTETRKRMEQMALLRANLGRKAMEEENARISIKETEKIQRTQHMKRWEEERKRIEAANDRARRQKKQEVGQAEGRGAEEKKANLMQEVIHTRDRKQHEAEEDLARKEGQKQEREEWRSIERRLAEMQEECKRQARQALADRIQKERELESRREGERERKQETMRKATIMNEVQEVDRRKIEAEEAVALNIQLMKWEDARKKIKAAEQQKQKKQARRKDEQKEAEARLKRQEARRVREEMNAKHRKGQEEEEEAARKELQTQEIDAWGILVENAEAKLNVLWDDLEREKQEAAARARQKLEEKKRKEREIEDRKEAERRAIFVQQLLVRKEATEAGDRAVIDSDQEVKRNYLVKKWEDEKKRIEAVEQRKLKEEARKKREERLAQQEAEMKKKREEAKEKMAEEHARERMELEESEAVARQHEEITEELYRSGVEAKEASQKTGAETKEDKRIQQGVRKKLADKCERERSWLVEQEVEERRMLREKEQRQRQREISRRKAQEEENVYIHKRMLQRQEWEKFTLFEDEERTRKMQVRQENEERERIEEREQRERKREDWFIRMKRSLMKDEVEDRITLEEEQDRKRKRKVSEYQRGRESMERKEQGSRREMRLRSSHPLVQNVTASMSDLKSLSGNRRVRGNMLTLSVGDSTTKVRSNTAPRSGSAPRSMISPRFGVSPLISPHSGSDYLQWSQKGTPSRIPSNFIPEDSPWNEIHGSPSSPLYSPSSPSSYRRRASHSSPGFPTPTKESPEGVMDSNVHEKRSDRSMGVKARALGLPPTGSGSQTRTSTRSPNSWEYGNDQIDRSVTSFAPRSGSPGLTLSAASMPGGVSRSVGHAGPIARHTSPRLSYSVEAPTREMPPNLSLGVSYPGFGAIPSSGGFVYLNPAAPGAMPGAMYLPNPSTTSPSLPPYGAPGLRPFGMMPP